MRVLPHVAGESVFALKGGTAINLIYRDRPRLSVDIDLICLPIKERAKSLDEINAAMDRIAASEDLCAGKLHAALCVLRKRERPSFNVFPSSPCSP